MNNSGQVIGAATTPTGAFHAVLWSTASPACARRLIPGKNEPALVAVFVDGVQTSTPNDDFYPVSASNEASDHPTVDRYCQPYAASNGALPPSVTGVLGSYHSNYLSFQSGATTPKPTQRIEDLPDALAAQVAVLLPYSYQGAYFSSPAGSSEPLFHVNYSASTDPGNTDVNQQGLLRVGGPLRGVVVQRPSRQERARTQDRHVRRGVAG